MQKQIYEKHIHDDPDFPFFFHVRMQAVPYSPDLFHWPESIELLYVLEGTLRAVCGEEVVTARAGDLVIVPPNALHAVCADGAPAVYHCLIVDKSFSDGLKLYLSGMRFRPCAASPEAGELFGRIAAEVTEKRALYKLSVRSYVMALLVFLCRDCRVAGEEELPGRGTHKIEMVKTVIEYLRLHFGEDLSIEDLCGVVGFSKYYLCHAFRQITGSTVVDYLNSLRCSHALQLLSSGEYTVGECAEKCGFHNLSYFAKVYRRYRGCSPSDELGKASVAT